jgi:hypothetical protein
MVLDSTIGTVVAGIIPTSVTTAVIFVGGVKSYRGLRTWRFLDDVSKETSVCAKDFGALIEKISVC